MRKSGLAQRTSLWIWEPSLTPRAGAATPPRAARSIGVGAKVRAQYTSRGDLALTRQSVSDEDERCIACAADDRNANDTTGRERGISDAGD